MPKVYRDTNWGLPDLVEGDRVAFRYTADTETEHLGVVSDHDHSTGQVPVLADDGDLARPYRRNVRKLEQ